MEEEIKLEMSKLGYVNIMDIDLDEYFDKEKDDTGEYLLERIISCIKENFSVLGDSQPIDATKIYCKVQNHILYIKVNKCFELRILPLRRTVEDSPLYEVSLKQSRLPGILVSMYDLVAIVKFYAAVLAEQLEFEDDE